MTAIDSNKLRELVKRMHANSLQMQEANKHNDPSYCVGWRGATNTYAIELMALIDRETAATIRSTVLHVRLQNVASVDYVGSDVAAVSVNGEQWPHCIDCGQPCPPDRDPLRCLVCQLDKDVATHDADVARAWESANASSPRLSFTPTARGLIINAPIEPRLTESKHREEKADTQED